MLITDKHHLREISLDPAPHRANMTVMAMQLTPREMLDKLVSFDTISSNSNLPLLDFVEEYLDSYGVRGTRVYDQTGEKANFYANVGPEVEDGVILSGHTDVVPVKGQDWSTDPFTVVEKDGKLYGRGTCDMKGFDALALTAVPLAFAADIKRPLQIALSYDEEVGCIGAPFMISEMREHLPAARGAIIGEPSMMQVVTGHKGTVGCTTRVRGYEVHSSMIHEGVSAVTTAARLVEWHRLQMESNKQSPDARFTPPYTTLHNGIIKGGTAGNITAKDCWFTTDIRCIPSENPSEWLAKYQAFAAEVEAEIQQIRPEASITIEPRPFVPGLTPEIDGPAEALARQLTGDNATHVVSYATEAGQFQTESFSSVICGPGSIDQAHQADEFISVEQFQRGERFMQDLVKTLQN